MFLFLLFMALVIGLWLNRENIKAWWERRGAAGKASEEATRALRNDIEVHEIIEKWRRDQ